MASAMMSCSDEVKLIFMLNYFFSGSYLADVCVVFCKFEDISLTPLSRLGWRSTLLHLLLRPLHKDLTLHACLSKILNVFFHALIDQL